MLEGRDEFGTQVQPRTNQDKPLATLADPSYLTWPEVPHSEGQNPTHLSHLSSWSLSDTPESWGNGQPRWVPHHEGVPRHFGGLSTFSGRGLPYDPGGPLGSYVFPIRGLPGPPGGGPWVCLNPLMEVPLVTWNL